MEKFPIPIAMGIARVDSQMEGPPIQLVVGRPPALSERGGPRARIQSPPMGDPPMLANIQMGDPPTASPMGNPPQGRGRMDSLPLQIPMGGLPAHLQMGNPAARPHMEHMPAMSMGSAQTHSPVGSPPARSSIESRPDSLQSSQRPSMCCSGMMKQASSLGGTGDLKCTSTTNTVSTSASYHNTNPYDRSASLSWEGDVECGVPSTPQHVRIDFTPNEGDTEFLKKKCSDFWKFIHSREDLQGMMVLPTPDKYPFLNEKSESSSTPVSSLISSTKQSKDIPVEKTALSLLEFVEEKGMADLAMAQKFYASKCSIPHSSPHSYPSDTNIRKPLRFKGLIEKRADKAKVKMATTNVRALCKELDEWDKTHPKSMEPPSHNPPLCYAVLQRKSEIFK